MRSPSGPEPRARTARSERGGAALLLIGCLSVAGCLSIAGLDKDYTDDLGSTGSGTGGKAGQAGASSGGTAGTGSAGKSGASQGIGGKSADCPPKAFTGLPNCMESATLSPCLDCVCNDVPSGCGPAFKLCLDDADCAKSVECALRQCPLATCETLATGKALEKSQALTACFTATKCASQCQIGKLDEEVPTFADQVC